MLKPVFELINFFKEQKEGDIIKFLKDDVASLAYLVDIFGQLNKLNISLQGRDKTIIDFMDTLSMQSWNYGKGR